MRRTRSGPTSNKRSKRILVAEAFKAVGPLPEAQRETVLLVYGEGYSYAEAASTLGISIGTVISRLAAARSALVTPSSASPTTPRCRCSHSIAKLS
jgi:RNA polymerase sigma-70 factor (ECF subfamily)